MTQVRRPSPFRGLLALQTAVAQGTVPNQVEA